MILSVVTISAVNEGGIFAHANNAITKYSHEAELENTYISNYLAYIEGKYNNDNNDTVTEHDIYYNTDYKNEDSTEWNNKTVDAWIKIKFDNNNNVLYTSWSDSDQAETKFSGIIDDGFGGHFMDTTDRTQYWHKDKINYGETYEAYNSLGLKVTFSFNNNGNLYQECTIPGEYISIDKTGRTINVASGKATGTYSKDGKTINILAKTFVANI